VNSVLFTVLPTLAWMSDAQNMLVDYYATVFADNIAESSAKSQFAV
jgi:hypothetical protein